MARAAVVVGAFAAGAATAVLALYAALRMAPGVIMADDMMDALVVVADPALSRFQSGAVVYVKSSVGPMLLDSLQSRHPSLRLRPFSARAEDHGCNPEAGAPAPPECERDDYLKLEVLSSPTPLSLLVAVGTHDAFGQVLLVKFWGRWRVLVDRRYAI